MCILQDFEAITPNTLARTIETVEGGGMVVLLLKSMKSLKQLYTMTMVKNINKDSDNIMTSNVIIIIIYYYYYILGCSLPLSYRSSS